MMEGMWLLLLLLAGLLFFLVVGFFQWLWNITMPDIVACKPIRYWQAFRLMLIVHILFAPTFIRFG
jgi:hypothetical protein